MLTVKYHPDTVRRPVYWITWWITTTYNSQFTPEILVCFQSW